MSKKIFIFLICLSLVFILFLYPFSILQEDYISAAQLTGEKKEITLSEPTIMLLIGFAMLAMGIFARKSFGKKTKDL